ncbi:MAG: hypothetical protein LQ345_001636 [Seirophora villosa]|nr:MAG: hypothetical protein LQ345_001636 [Seirophora villosa]
MEAKPIPAFYCCYLLRSAKTESSKRWAWQNFHITKKVTDQQRGGKAKQPQPIKQPKPKKPVDPEQSVNPGRNQKVPKKKRIRRPQVTLKRALTDLHVLLRVPSFNKWPLAVRFFCEDVYQKWLNYTKQANGQLRKNFHVTMDSRVSSEPTAKAERHVDPQTGHKRKFAPSGVGGVEGIDVSYSGLKAHVKKSIRLLAEQSIKRCSVCVNDIDSLSSTVVVCLTEECRAITHMACLAKQRSDDRESDELLPVSVRCPLCHSDHLWLDLVKELSIRVRGVKDLAQLTKVPQKPKKTVRLMPMDTALVESTWSDIEDVVRHVEDRLTRADLLDQDAADDPLPDDWHAFDANSDEESVASTDTAFSNHVGSPVKPTKQRQQLPAVIEDSEWDSAEVLD